MKKDNSTDNVDDRLEKVTSVKPKIKVTTGTFNEDNYASSFAINTQIEMDRMMSRFNGFNNTINDAVSKYVTPITFESPLKDIGLNFKTSIDDKITDRFSRYFEKINFIEPYYKVPELPDYFRLHEPKYNYLPYSINFGETFNLYESTSLSQINLYCSRTEGRYQNLLGISRFENYFSNQNNPLLQSYLDISGYKSILSDYNIGISRSSFYDNHILTEPLSVSTWLLKQEPLTIPEPVKEKVQRIYANQHSFFKKVSEEPGTLPILKLEPKLSTYVMDIANNAIETERYDILDFVEKLSSTELNKDKKNEKVLRQYVSRIYNKIKEFIKNHPEKALKYTLTGLYSLFFSGATIYLSILSNQYAERQAICAEKQTKYADEEAYYTKKQYELSLKEYAKSSKKSDQNLIYHDCTVRNNENAKSEIIYFLKKGDKVNFITFSKNNKQVKISYTDSSFDFLQEGWIPKTAFNKYIH